MSQDCVQSHCYSVRFGSPTTATGVLMNTHRNFLTPGGTPSPTTPWFFTSEMWLAQPSQANYWVEMGIVEGWHMNLNTTVYADFAWWRNTAGADSGWMYLRYNIPDGTTHYYQVSRGPAWGTWLIMLDSNVVLTTGNTGFWTGQPQVGGECYCSSTNEHADTFDMYTKYVDSSGTVRNYSAAGYSVHAGMNGVDHGTYWSWNAP